MKKRLLLYTIIILSACAQDNFRLVQGDKFDKQEVRNAQKKNVDKEVAVSIPTETIDEEPQTTTAHLDENSQLEQSADSPSDRQVQRAERFERFEEKHLKDNPEARELVETVKKISGVEDEPMDLQLKLGIIFLVLALVAFLFYVLFYVKATTVDENVSTPDGCFNAIFDAVFYTILAVIFGVGTVVFLALGIVFLILGIVSMNKKTAAK
jgi:hypothetical protein